MLDRILVALDGSSYSEQTLPFAAAIARAFDSEVVLLRIAAGQGSGSRSLDSFDWRMDRAEAYEYLEEIKERLEAASVSTDIDVSSGRASEEILEIASARDVDLVAIASHGSGGQSQFHMAGTAQKVVFGCHTSVLVVPSCEPLGEGPPFTSVLVPVDGSANSEWAVRVSARLARDMGADLVVIHVVREPMLVDPQGTEHERRIVDELVALNRHAAARYLDNLKRRLASEGLRVRALVEVSDDIAPVLEHHADADDRPLIVLNGRGDATQKELPLGSLVTAMLANSRHPVLVLRESRSSAGPQATWRDAGARQPRAVTPR